MPGEAANVRLVDDGVDQRNVERLVVLPVEMILGNNAVARRPRLRRVGAPSRAVGKHMRVRIEQHVRGIVAMHLRIGIGLHVEAIAVLRTGIQAFDEGVPNLAGTIGMRIERELGKRLVGSGIEEHQRARGCVLGKHREVDAGAAQQSAKGQRNSTTHLVGGHAAGGEFLGCGLTGCLGMAS